jgi:hypothetical protein
MILDIENRRGSFTSFLRALRPLPTNSDPNSGLYPRAEISPLPHRSLFNAAWPVGASGASTALQDPHHEEEEVGMSAHVTSAVK